MALAVSVKAATPPVRSPVSLKSVSVTPLDDTRGGPGGDTVAHDDRSNPKTQNSNPRHFVFIT
jgi:hypothetical protein